MAPPRGKKRKADDAGSPSDVAADAKGIEVEHGDIWFADGSVVLIAENKGFKVYQGILSRHSEVFKDMFALPQPADAESCDGCPVVRMQDTAKDLGTFLSALHDSTARYLNPTKILPFDEVSTMLRLGSKYNVESMRADAIRRLKSCFPDKLEDFANSRTRTALYDSDDMTKYYQTSDITIVFHHCRHVIKLARSHDLDSMLPAAFYSCAQMTIQGIVARTGLPYELSDADIVRCLQGRNTLKLTLRRSLLDAVRQAGLEGSDCQNIVSCTSKKTRMVEQLCHYDLGPYALLDHGILRRILAIDVCPACIMRCNSTYDAAKQETWTNLRTHFDLPPPPPPVGDE
ncbi:hypothetical protein EIP91_000487 [Steccherinum ochraceum]|uniref:BTB domain-containing protein n=1 Tax=Steccherinum ochraceum TaxID=92696 RepID=A0A4R0RXX4_9APHY|nr:hypothetical protein EIP91_000487 [Steccherinum ochraceum]